MKPPSIRPVRCAIYTRVSTEHGLDQEFNSLDALIPARNNLQLIVRAHYLRDLLWVTCAA